MGTSHSSWFIDICMTSRFSLKKICIYQIIKLITKMKKTLSVYYIFLFKRYDLKETSKLTLQDVQLICAMGPPGGGRNDVTLRFMRHFNIIGMNSFSEETMIKIFSILISTYLRVSRECFFHFCYQFYYLINTIY
jgi:hypothetical protein